MTIVKRSTTGIGSLPHSHPNVALDYSFRMGIPFLPQLSMSNPSEDMRTPGISLSSWGPFLDLLREHQSPLAKIQITGPITTRWSFRPLDQEPPTQIDPAIFTQCLAQSLAMTGELQSINVQPLLYLDEPALYALSPENPLHLLAIQGLNSLIQSLKKEGVIVGLHCCSNPRWDLLLGPQGIHPDFLSIDTGLSLKSLLSAPENLLEKYIRSGGRLSLGIIPTDRSRPMHSLKVTEIFTQLIKTFTEAWSHQPALIHKVLNDAIYTPACGLALHSVTDSELILALLNQFYDACTSNIREQDLG